MPKGPMIKEKDAFKVPEIMIKNTKDVLSPPKLNHLSHFKRFKANDFDKNSVSKISTFSIDSQSSCLSLRLLGAKQSFTDK